MTNLKRCYNGNIYKEALEHFRLMDKRLRFIDLFGGIGGFRFGIEKATNWKCVW